MSESTVETMPDERSPEVEREMEEHTVNHIIVAARALVTRCKHWNEDCMKRATGSRHLCDLAELCLYVKMLPEPKERAHTCRTCRFPFPHREAELDRMPNYACRKRAYLKYCRGDRSCWEPRVR